MALFLIKLLAFSTPFPWKPRRALRATSCADARAQTACLTTSKSDAAKWLRKRLENSLSEPSHHFLRGSMASRTPSPRKLIATVAAAIMTAGGTQRQGMNCST